MYYTKRKLNYCTPDDHFRSFPIIPWSTLSAHDLNLEIPKLPAYVIMLLWHISIIIISHM